MRAVLLPPLLLLSACSSETAEPLPADSSSNASTSLGSELRTFAGAGKDRLCLGGTNASAAVITYAADGLNNCSARGRMEEQGGKLFFVPQEDTTCRIEVRREGDTRLTFTAPAASCSYYCGPGATLEGKTFARMDRPEPVTDVAGDPLC